MNFTREFNDIKRRLNLLLKTNLPTFDTISERTLGAGVTITSFVKSPIVKTAAISESVSGNGIFFNHAIIRQLNAVAKNITASATAAELAKGLITSTSAAAVALTLPTAALLATQLGIRNPGGLFEFVVDNSAGANTVTVTVAAGITVATAVVTGADTLTVAAGKVGIFRLYFYDTTHALLYRMG